MSNVRVVDGIFRNDLRLLDETVDNAKRRNHEIAGVCRIVDSGTDDIDAEARRLIGATSFGGFKGHSVGDFSSCGWRCWRKAPKGGRKPLAPPAGLQKEKKPQSSSPL